MSLARLDIMNRTAVASIVLSLSLLVGGMALPLIGPAAPWLSGRDTFASDWVTKVEQELSKREYRYVFANDPRTPQASIVRLLNQAARAQAAQKDTLAKDLATQAVDIL